MLSGTPDSDDRLRQFPFVHKSNPVGLVAIL
jgi:hypothetical protein